MIFKRVIRPAASPPSSSNINDDSEEGSNVGKPLEGALCKVHLVGTHGGVEFENTRKEEGAYPREFNVGGCPW